MLDGIYESWKALEVLAEQEAAGFPDMLESTCLAGTDAVVGMRLKMLHGLTVGYHPRAMRPQHALCRELLGEWNRNYCRPDTDNPHSASTATWMQNTLDTVLGLRSILFEGTGRAPPTTQVGDN